jgi:hypothetical protein
LLDFGADVGGNEDGFPSALLLVGAAVVVLIATLGFAFWPRRR